MRELLHTELTKIGTSRGAQTLSDEIKRYESCMNATLGHMLYQDLNDEEKASVWALLLSKLKGNNKTPPEEFLIAEKIASDETYAGFVARYKGLTEKEKKITFVYNIKRRKEKTDASFCRRDSAS